MYLTYTNIWFLFLLHVTDHDVIMAYPYPKIYKLVYTKHKKNINVGIISYAIKELLYLLNALQNSGNGEWQMNENVPSPILHSLFTV